MSCPGWSSGPVLRAETFRQRLAGLRRQPPDHGLLMAASSVHGLGMGRGLWAVGLGTGWRVLAVRRVERGHLVWVRGARWILELPADRDPPPLGAVLALDAGPVS